MSEYMARATLHFTWANQGHGIGGAPVLPNKLPVSMGPFRLDYSPNSSLYGAELAGIEPEQMAEIPFDPKFPVSLLYVDANLQALEGQNPEELADEQFERLEMLLRLFQTGNISIRRYSKVWEVKTGQMRYDWDGAWGKPVLESFGSLRYWLDDETLVRFVDFFNKHWVALPEIASHVRRALIRFNSSYERPDPVDRLLDLCTALEALFGDREPNGITYKLATRCACWLHPIGENRLAIFNNIKRMYQSRSRAVHGDHVNVLEESQLAELEGILRASLVKFLDQHGSVGRTPQDVEFDKMIMTGRL